MKTKILISTLLIVLFAVFLFIPGCKKSDKGTPTLKAAFTYSPANPRQGDSVHFVNQSQGANEYLWTCPALGIKSTDQDLNFVFTRNGKYNITLSALTGNGKNNVTETVTITADTTYWIHGNSAKSWLLISAKFNGTEQIQKNCQRDNLFIVRKDSTFSYTEGADICPQQDQILPPMSGIYEFTNNYSQVLLNVRKPSTNAMLYYVTKLSQDSMVVTDTSTTGDVTQLELQTR